MRGKARQAHSLEGQKRVQDILKTTDHDDGVGESFDDAEEREAKKARLAEVIWTKAPSADVEMEEVRRRPKSGARSTADD